MACTSSSQNISCLAIEKQMLLVLWITKESMLEHFISTGFKLELLLVSGEIKYASLFRVVFKQKHRSRQMCVLRFSPGEKCLKYFLDWGNRNLPLETLSFATYQIQRELQKAVSLDNEIESLDTNSEQ